MSDPALLDAVSALSKGILSLCDELTQSRIIQQDMANTLIRIHDDNQQILARMDQLQERASTGEKRQADSASRIKVLERKVAIVEERLTHVETSPALATRRS
jgi:hypothetical protein